LHGQADTAEPVGYADAKLRRSREITFTGSYLEAACEAVGAVREPPVQNASSQIGNAEFLRPERPVRVKRSSSSEITFTASCLSLLARRQLIISRHWRGAKLTGKL